MNERMPGAQVIGPDQGSGLVNWYDLDPQKWVWFAVPTNIEVGVDANASARGEIALLNHPQYLTKITHQIIGNTGDPETSGLTQDGQYSIEMKDQKTTFTLNPVQANNLFGPMINGQFPELPFPKYYQGVNTLQFTVTNLINRILSPEADTFIIQLCVHGVADLSIGGAR